MRKSTVCIFIPSQELEYTLQSSKLPSYVINHFSWFGIIEYSHLGFFNVCLQKKISLTLIMISIRDHILHLCFVHWPLLH